MNFFRINRTALSTGRWLLSDFFFRYRLELVWITFLGAIAAGVQTGILVGLHKIMGGHFDAELSQWLSASHSSLMFGAGLAALFALAAYLNYLNGCQTLALWPRFQIHSLNSLIDGLHKAVARGAVDTQSLKNSVFRKCLRGTQRLGSLSRLITKGILPFFRFLGFTGYALYINPSLTLILLLVGAPISAASLLMFFRRAAECDRAAEAKASESYRYQDALQLTALSQESFVPIKSDALSNGSVLTQRLDNLVSRFIWVERAKLATTLTTIGGLGLVITLFEGGMGPNWGQLLVYLLALIMAFAQLIQLASLVTTVGRFYPTVARHRKMLEAMALSQSVADFSQRIAAAGLVDTRDVADSDDDLE